jgi:hypothetical protein
MHQRNITGNRFEHIFSIFHHVYTPRELPDLQVSKSEIYNKKPVPFNAECCPRLRGLLLLLLLAATAACLLLLLLLLACCCCCCCCLLLLLLAACCCCCCCSAAAAAAAPLHRPKARRVAVAQEPAIVGCRSRREAAIESEVRHRTPSSGRVDDLLKPICIFHHSQRMSASGVELSAVSQSSAALPSPDLLIQFNSLAKISPDVAPVLSTPAPMPRPIAAPKDHPPSAARVESRIHALAASKSRHAEAAAPPQSGLMHPLAHVRYKPPVHAISSVAGMKQHIAHYFHLYHTGTDSVIARLCRHCSSCESS